ncbi:negative elongation factor E-like [Babylonia areolata]|uniref:negative elongation factor E-like n=1 Tax=Babylonia areolata TaxID=304850 RepID=UPI003FD28191
MVFLTFPNALTDEEEMLKHKYAKLRKKKKQLLALKATKPEAQQKPSDQVLKKPPESAGEATEQAKKLVQSGAIKVGSGSKEKTGFKKSKHLEKKLKDTDKQTTDIKQNYKPFSSSVSADDDDKLEPSKPKLSRLSDSFVASSSRHHDDRRDRDREDRRERGRDGRDREPPSKGHTVYVHGIGVTEEILKSAFSNFGNIVNINIEREKVNGFVTFEKMESADQAIANMNGSMISNVQLKVSMARRQPTFDTQQDPSQTNWSTIAADENQKGPCRKDDRDLVTYDDDDLF